MSTPNITSKSRTDVQYQEVKLFIEGVQVPFLSISVSSTLNELPQAQISLPPQVGLMEISKFYNPKVHIFFLDPVDGEEKVLFSGIIMSSSMSKTAEGNSSMNFLCAHKNHLMTELLMDFSSWTDDPQNAQVNNEGALKANALSSKLSVGMALTGIFNDGKKEVTKENVDLDKKNGTSTTSPNVIPAFLTDFSNRILGMPSVLINLWNQLKEGAYKLGTENEVMTTVYIPLVEQGLQFFQRMAGHFYLEEQIENDRVAPCTDNGSPISNNKSRYVPPCSRIFLRSAAQTTLVEEQIFSMIQNSGELVNLFSIFFKYLNSIDYEFLFLNSPAEVFKNPKLDAAGNFIGNTNSTFAVDTIVKPQIPFYFSPACNIVYPSMLRSINVTQDDYSIPTRVTLTNQMPITQTKITDQYYRAPASIREAIAYYTPAEDKTGTLDTPSTTIKTGTRQEVTTGNQAGTSAFMPRGNLKVTLNASHGKVGKFEQGRGVRAEKADMPKWLKYFSKSQEEGLEGQNEAVNEKDTRAVDALKRGWIARNGLQASNLNPWDDASGLIAHQRLLVAAADYFYSMAVARSKSGTATTIFNPYMVVGYPIDILDSTPNHPSFHAYCTSVTHVITQDSISTSVGFVSAMTYTELANYYTLPVHPWLLYALGLAESQSIVDYSPSTTPGDPATPLDFGNEAPQNPSAAEVANRFYKTTLGVGAAQPTMLYDFNSGITKPVDRQGYGLIPGSTGSTTGQNRGELNPNLTGVGNLSLVYRNIESRDKVEERWNIKFIDLIPGNYNQNAIKINSQVLADRNKLELGESIWLDYNTPGVRAFQTDVRLVDSQMADLSKRFQTDIRAIDDAIEKARKKT